MNTGNAIDPTHNSQKRMMIGFLTTAISLPILLIALTPWTEFHIRMFCAPAAYMAAMFLSAPVQVMENGYLIPLAFPIEVTTACSAIKFFCLSLAVFSGMAMEQRWSLRWRIALIPVVYGLSVLANASRIICTWYIYYLLAPHLPDIFKSGMHGLLGALIFMTTMTAVYAILWRYNNEHRKQTLAA